MDLGLKDKVAVVLASSKGLGRGCALRLAEEGCRVAVCARGKDALEATADELRNRTGRPVLVMTADVGKKEDRERFLEAVLKEFGTIHILVTNNGGPPTGSGLEIPDEEWRRAVDSTLMVAVDWTRAAAPIMVRQKWGRIICITSIGVKQPIDGLILSNTMRAGVTGFAKTMSKELAPHGVLINTVCPGSHKTDRLKQLAGKRAKDAGTSVDEQWRKLAADIPVGRLGTPGEFGSLVAFLASDRASYITGATIQVDGGLYGGLL